jgi:hypothetical protein
MGVFCIITNGSLMHFSKFVHCLTYEDACPLDRAIVGILSVADIQYRPDQGRPVRLSGVTKPVTESRLWAGL